jgi:hypothetical protein
LAARVEERSCAHLFGQVRETRLERTAVCPCGTDSRARLRNSADFVGENQTSLNFQIRPKSPKLEEKKNQRHRLNFATAPNVLTLLQRGDVRRVEPIDASGIKDTTKLTFPE